MSVVNQVLKFKFDEEENKAIIRGWLQIANCFDVDQEKLRAVDDMQLLASLDYKSGEMTAALNRLLAQKATASAAEPVAEDTTLIELSRIVGHN